MVVVRATVIKIARAIIILKPAFLVVPSLVQEAGGGGGTTVKQTGGGGTGEDGRPAREQWSAVDIGRGTGRRRWKRGWRRQ